MKRLVIGIGFICITALKLFSQTAVIGPISANTTWSLTGSPYIITSDLVIDDGVTLVIEAGIEIKIEGAEILSFGKIIAQGTNANKIRFTSNKSTPNAQDWEQIHLAGDFADNSELSYCIIEYANVGLLFDESSGVLRNSIVRYCERSGISISVGSPKIQNCIIHDITHEGFGIASGSPIVEANLIFNNTDGIITDFANSYICNNIIYNNTRYGIDNRNANSTGSQATIINNTLDGNGILGIEPFGANINCDNSSPIIKNNIITNSTNNIGSGYGAGIRATSGGAPIISYNDLYGNTGGNYTVYNVGTCSAGVGDISLDPQYFNRTAADYHLSDTSPCLSSAYALGAPTRDFESKVRGNPPDMGAIENISDGDQTLPVQLTSFTAEYTRNEIILRWVTQTEVNNLGYEIFCRESSEINYHLLASYKYNTTLKGKGTTPQTSTYSFTDNRILPDKTYYYGSSQYRVGNTSLPATR